MKKFINKKTKDIWYALCKEHINYLSNNPNFKEIKEEEKPKSEKKGTKVPKENEVENTTE